MRGQPLGAFDLVKYCHQGQTITLVQTVVNPLVLSRLGVVPLALFGVSLSALLLVIIGLS